MIMGRLEGRHGGVVVRRGVHISTWEAAFWDGRIQVFEVRKMRKFVRKVKNRSVGEAIDEYNRSNEETIKAQIWILSPRYFAQTEDLAIFLVLSLEDLEMQARDSCIPAERTVLAKST